MPSNTRKRKLGEAQVLDEDKTVSKRFRRVLLEMPVADCIPGAKYSRAPP